MCISFTHTFKHGHILLFCTWDFIRVGLNLSLTCSLFSEEKTATKNKQTKIFRFFFLTIIILRVYNCKIYAYQSFINIVVWSNWKQQCNTQLNYFIRRIIQKYWYINVIIIFYVYLIQLILSHLIYQCIGRL